MSRALSVLPAAGSRGEPLLRRLARSAVSVGLAVWLAGCGTLSSISVDVASFGAWPAGRAPGTFAIDRLPSQQQGSATQLLAEDAARTALAQAGFTRAAEPAQADVLVQIGVRRARVLDPWAEYGWLGTRTAWRMSPAWAWPQRSPFWGPGPFIPADTTLDQTEVALLLLDRPTRKVLYESHVRYETRAGTSESLWPTLFAAGLQGFPTLATGERRVVVPVLGAAK